MAKLEDKSISQLDDLIKALNESSKSAQALRKSFDNQDVYIAYSIKIKIIRAIPDFDIVLKRLQEAKKCLKMNLKFNNSKNQYYD